MDDEVADGDAREIAPLVLRPLLPAVDGDPETELRAEEEEILIDEILAEDVRVAADRRVGGDHRRPRLAEVARAVGVRLHVAERVEVERGEGGPFIEVAGVNV